MPLTPDEEKRLREKIQRELREREATLRADKDQKEEERQRKLESQLREKIREEEEEKYFTERGYIKYINHHGLVEWLTPEEVEKRKKRRRSKKTSSKRKKQQIKRAFQISSNIGLVLIAGMILLFLYKYNPTGASNHGSITVNSDIPGCMIFLDGFDVNHLTPHTLDKISTGTHFVSVFREGFTVWPPMIPVSVQKDKIAMADFIVKHFAFMGEIVIESNLNSFDLYIDGLHFETTNSRLQLPVGYHVITAVKAGYLATPSHQRVLVEREGTKTLRFQFDPDEEIAYLQISSNRKSEYIYLDNILTGIKAAGKPFPVKAGTYVVSIRQNGYLTTPESKIISTLPGEKKLVVFHSIPVKERSSLSISTPLPGAAITLNGDWSSLVTPVKDLSLSPGSHYINLMRGDNLYSQKDVAVDPARLKNNELKIKF